MNLLPRVSGFLLHPTCLPGPHYVGDFGEQSYRFVDFLHRASQRLWAILPLAPTGYDNSPYSAHSAFAGNPLLISLHALHHDGLLDTADVADGNDCPRGRADFEAARAFKMPRLRRAFERFADGGGEDSPTFAAFREQASDWLEDYALFMALKDAHGGRAWTNWSAEFARRDPSALARARRQFAAMVRFHRFLQYEFHVQWSRLKRYANEHAVRLVGDIPMFVAQDSADVWSRPDHFKLDTAGRPYYLTGAPPGYFSATGQLWGSPLYDWARQSADGFAWWIRRFGVLLRHVDIVRIDHLRGFQACWAVPAGEQTAEHGAWVEGPGAALFDAVTATLGTFPVFAEDTGLITAEEDALRERLGFPGIRLLHWGFEEPDAFHGADSVQRASIRRHLPHNFPRACVVYTSTHDTDTTAGWFAGLSQRGRERVQRYIGREANAISHDLIRLALASVADTAIVPVQDVLGLGSEARMNVPGRVGGNWCWRLAPDQLTPAHADMLADLTEIYDRTGAWPTATGTRSEPSTA